MKSEEVVKDVFHRGFLLLGSAVILLALFSAAGAAAPGSKAYANKTVLDPTVSTPVWISRTQARTESTLLEVMHALRVIDRYGDGPAVNVPARPKPRSPFMPPSEISLSDLPPWVLE